MRILKVAHIVEPYPEAGGFGTRVGMIARWLTGRGHDVTVVSTDCGPRAPTPEQNGGPEMVYLPAVWQHRRVGIGPAMFRFAAERTQTYDVVHVYGNYSLLAPIMVRAARKAGVPHVFEPAGSLPPAVRSMRRKKLYLATIGRAVVQGARAVLVSSDRELQQLSSWQSQTLPPLVLRRNGVSLPELLSADRVSAWRRRFAGDRDRRIVLFLGRICQVKAIDVLVEACACSGEPHVLVLAGPDDGDGTLPRARAAAQRLGVELIAPGAVSAAERWAVLAAADIVVLPSHSESFGLAAAEAMAVGVPVIVSSGTGIARWVAAKGAGVVVATDVAQLAAALRDLLGDAAARAALGERARIAARELGWDEPLLQLERIYAWSIHGGTTAPPGSA